MPQGKGKEVGTEAISEKMMAKNSPKIVKIIKNIGALQIPS